ncbi:MAG TPA: hypothetical protein VLF67_02960, partial [Candidatus Saccharimonas sp.]|nr:hypothetical protein [Candidatus Saccharimonas sp.]
MVFSLVVIGILVILLIASLAVMLAVVINRRHAPAVQPASAAPAPSAASGPSQTTAATAAQPEVMLPPLLVDTSANINGRIADIATAGFIPGRL